MSNPSHNSIRSGACTSGLIFCFVAYDVGMVDAVAAQINALAASVLDIAVIPGTSNSRSVGSDYGQGSDSARPTSAAPSVDRADGI